MIALGGGAFMDKAIRYSVLKNSVSIWLDANINTLNKRSMWNQKRPLLQKENNFDKIQEEIGDILFTLINLSRFLNISAENALRRSNKKFVKRFQLLENKIVDLNKNIDECSSKELHKIWNRQM